MIDPVDRMLRSVGLSKSRIDEIKSMRNDSLPTSNERIGIIGNLRIIAIRDNTSRVVVDDKNTITNKGFEIMSKIWSNQFGGSSYASNYRPGLIAIGTGTISSGSIPAAVALNSLSIISGGSYNSITTSLVGSNGCKFEWILETTQGNGTTFQEAGLFPLNIESSATGAGGMLAYKTYTPLNKTSDYALLYSWSFTFSAA